MNIAEDITIETFAKAFDKIGTLTKLHFFHLAIAISKTSK